MKYIFLIIFLLVPTSNALADEIEFSPKDFYHINFEVQGNSKRLEAPKERRTYISGFFPIYKKRQKEDEIRYYDLNLEAAFQKSEFETGIFSRSIQTNSSSIQAVSHIFSKNGDVYILRAGGLVQQEVSGPTETTIPITGIAIDPISGNSKLIYGFFYGYQLDGRVLLLPILGVHSELSANWFVIAILPLSVRATYRMSECLKVSLFLKPDSLRFKVKNEDDFPEAESELTFRSQRFKTGADINWRLNTQWDLTSELGFLSKQKIILSDQDSLLDEYESEASSYLKLGVRYSF